MGVGTRAPQLLSFVAGTLMTNSYGVAAFSLYSFRPFVASDGSCTFPCMRCRGSGRAWDVHTSEGRVFFCPCHVSLALWWSSWSPVHLGLCGLRPSRV